MHPNTPASATTGIGGHAAGSRRVELLVEDLRCPTCADTVEQALRAVPGVAAATVNRASGVAFVDYDPARTSVITRYGMSETLGLATFEEPRPGPFPRGAVGPTEGVQRADGRAINTEIQKLFEAAHGRVRETLGAKRVTLEALAKLPIAKEVVDRAALAQVIAETQTAAGAAGDQGHA